MRSALTLIFTFLAIPAFAGPVIQSQCGLAADNTYRVELKFAKGFDFGQLVIKNQDQDYSQDLTRYQENKFVADVVTTLPVTGYALDYRLAGVGEFVTYSGNINCDEHRKKRQSDVEGEYSFLSNSGDGSDSRKINSLNDLDEEVVYDADEDVALDY